MINKMKSIVFDVDGTLCPIRKPDEDYSELEPFEEMISLLREYKSKGFYIILYSARNMNTFQGNVGRIAAVTGKQLMEWLERHDIPYDEMHLGKPWPGRGGFYVDDKSIRPDEFLKLSYEEILALIGEEPGGQ
ncbi:capsular biosynthesis protein [Citrobacter braakii]|jgi:capsule biosynthesis phosphatase|uniref:capsular biosynthesis protein n=1 Tax=Citrobacter TaxID=544 RepID=UPI0014615355|nr:MULTISPECIES: capsular biosynthesis protein [Citrobacter]MBA7795208.1 capsular biosynthesis protein [Citrobacter sp. RHBSTW-01065]MDL4471975.1 capsular biosynthesis protein [Citrobacter braakii]MDL4503704.1 capsular biosynthesis protein [Citrobacter braakii]MDM3338925.1 capsular biosynthesis protein [Citrobacter sp. Cb043]MDM3381683.1 capsular biosynthesis protein [Citrobacter sp. Cb003]